MENPLCFIGTILPVFLLFLYQVKQVTKAHPLHSKGVRVSLVIKMLIEQAFDR